MGTYALNITVTTQQGQANGQALVRTLNNIVTAAGQVTGATTSASKGVDVLADASKRAAAAFAAWRLEQFAQESIQAAGRYQELGVVLDVVGAKAGYTAGQLQQ